MDLAGGLEPGPEEMLRMALAVLNRVVHHIDSLPMQRASDTVDGDEAARLVMEALPETGAALGPLLDLFFERVLSKGYNTASPGTLSYVTGGGLFHAAIADFIGAATNPYVAYWGASPGCAQIEHTVVRWFCDIIGLPSSAGGVLTSGGSIANLTAVTTARILRLGDDFSKGVIYASDELHHSVEKAVALAGFPVTALKAIPTDALCRMRSDVLTRTVHEDRARGARPFLVIATAGTTSTGAVDDIETIADIAEREGLWLHVDAAYGGFFAMTERGRAKMVGMGRADTITLDPHKSLFLPFGTGCILAKRMDDLRRAHLVHADYIQNAVSLGHEVGATNAADLSSEMSRDFRGIRVWLPMKLLGAARFRECLDEKLDLAIWASAQLRRTPWVEMLAEPQLSILAFRIAPPGCDAPRLDGLNMRILQRINHRGRVHLSPTIVHGNYALRICVLSFRVHREQIAMCLEDLHEAIEAEWENPGNSGSEITSS